MNPINLNLDKSNSFDNIYNLVTLLSKKYNIPEPSDDDFTNSPQKEKNNNDINKEQLDKIFSVISRKGKKDK